MDHTPSTSHRWHHDYSLASGGLPASLSHRLVHIGGLLPTTIFGAARTSRKNWARAIGTQRWALPTWHIHHLLPLAPIQNGASPYPVCMRTITMIPHRSCLSHRLNLLGVLDSPIIMWHDSLGCHMPLSPPPTLPMKTQALPLEDDISLPSIPELDDSESLPLLHTLSLPRDEEPLSPISPEWATNGIPLEISPSPEHSFLLYRSCCNNFDYLLGYPTPASSSSS
jgi:hypothetical protein